MNRYKHIILALSAVIGGLLLFGSCCSGKPDTMGYDFESVVKKDYADMVGMYGDSAKLYVACGYLNYTYEEIIDCGISLDSVYITNMFTIFQVGDTVVEITHIEDVEDPVVEKNVGEWMECRPITPETEITAMEALGMFLSSGAVEDSACAPFANSIVLRFPYCIDNSRYCYLFGYDSVFVILDEHGKLTRCSE